MCSCPVGDGAKRTRTLSFWAMYIHGNKSQSPAWASQLLVQPTTLGQPTPAARISSDPIDSSSGFPFMPSSAIGPLILFLAILLTGAHLLGYLFARLRQPRVIGEILAGILLGPFLLGKLAFYDRVLQLSLAPGPRKAALDLLYQLGLLLLMFLSGAETKALFQRHERRQIAWLASVGTALPFFIMLALGSVLPLG